MGALVDFYAKLHASEPYGTGGHRKAREVAAALAPYRVQTVCDWGAGSQTLKRTLKGQRQDLDIYCYDPAIPEIAEHKLPSYDAVVSTDVLEHIPYEEIDAVIQELVRITDVVGYHQIAYNPAQLWLPDGRNAHLIQQKHAWWAKKFRENGANVVADYDYQDQFACITFTKDKR